jgi:hypothetical protein
MILGRRSGFACHFVNLNGNSHHIMSPFKNMNIRAKGPKYRCTKGTRQFNIDCKGKTRNDRYRSKSPQHFKGEIMIAIFTANKNRFRIDIHYVLHLFHDQNLKQLEPLKKERGKSTLIKPYF